MAAVRSLVSSPEVASNVGGGFIFHNLKQNTSRGSIVDAMTGVRPSQEDNFSIRYLGSFFEDRKALLPKLEMSYPTKLTHSAAVAAS